ncbi:c-type cytochrome biogenesis protein CcmI [Zavarzinia compransoris]|uniref:c-type cytochrome biogenesis protein CcmI n=1 Tax=Zavarzinia marina TaxID=2911065 RepID=UPI001F43D2A8|nr:c-type cytochrome biogenesis protein CcmI [Zavarzinia marina]MCF4165920.1 c-type cytochrome biogenesis protein CcmI [Zavarzinia marina]
MTFALFALLAAAVAIVLLRPLLKAGPARDQAAAERAVYRAQLQELAAEQESGAIAPAEAEGARLEIQRRLLKVGEGAATRAKPSLVLALAVALGVPAAAALIYDRMGAGGLPDQPLAERVTDAGSAAETDKLVDALEKRLAEAPDDPRGWALMARVRASEGRLIDAAEAYEKVAALVPQSVEARLGAAELRIAAAQGQVTPEVRKLVTEAQGLQPDDPGVRHFAAYVRFADGDKAGAAAAWRAVLADLKTDDPLRPAVEAGLKAAGEPVPEAPGPSAADIEAAGEMSADDRKAMIEGMVARLAERLEREPGDVDGWLRLARAYEVMGRGPDAVAAWEKAAALRPDDAAIAEGLAAARARFPAP